MCVSGREVILMGKERDFLDLISSTPIVLAKGQANFESINTITAEKLFLIAKPRRSQIILAINPVDITEGSFIRELARTETVITLSLLDNPFLPEDFIEKMQKENYSI